MAEHFTQGTIMKLKGAIIGNGFIANHGHFPAYLKRNDVSIIAVSDIVKRDHPDNRLNYVYFNDYKQMLDQINDLHFVDISTHAGSHYEIAKDCLNHGLHVLCEKPLTINFSQALELYKLAQKNKLILFPCHNYKHSPVVKSIKRVVKSNKIGKIHTVTLNTFRNTHAVGTNDWKPDWRRYKNLSGGGIAMDHGSHSLYLTFDWLECYPSSVCAFGHNKNTNIYDTEDTFNASFLFPNGKQAHVFLTWTAGVRKVIYTLQGERGAIRVEEDDMEVAIMREHDKDSISHKAAWDFERTKISSDWMDSSHVNWFNSMFDKFIYAIEKQQIEHSDIKDALWCVHCIESAYKSINQDNKKIVIPDIGV